MDEFYSPTIAITHLTVSRMPTMAVRIASAGNMPGMKGSTEAARSSATGKVTMNGKVAMVRDISSLDTIA